MERYGEYKDSGVEWIGEIPAGWEVLYPKKCFFLRKDKATEGDQQLTASQQYGIISQADFMEREGRRVVSVITGEEILKHVGVDDFVISMRSFQGGLEYSAVEGKISSAYVMVVPNKAFVQTSYFKYLFKSAHYIEALQSTSNLVRDGQAMRFSNFVQVFLLVPPLQEQNVIANFLDNKTAEINALVTDQEKSLELLREYRKAVISEAVTKGLDPNVPMKDSGIDWIGDIPEGWSLQKLKSIAALATIRDESNKKYIGLENVESWIGTCDSIDDNAIVEGQTLKRGSGDVLFAKLRPYLAKVFVSADEGCCSSEFLVIKPSAIQSEYLKYALLSAKYIDHINAQTYGSKMPRANWEMVGGSHIPLPPKETQNYIASKLDQRIGEIDSLIAGKQQLIDKLKEYRKSLISEAVTGRFKVPGVEEE